jgi:AraC-like DNA-binding protein
VTDALIARTWIGSGAAATVLPDGCADLVWTGGRLVVVGPATRPLVAEATPGEPRFGLRLRVGAIETALGVPAAELRDLEVPLTELWGPRCDETVVRAAQAGAGPGVAALRDLVRSRAPAAAPDPLVRNALWLLRRPGTGLRDAGRVLGIGERQLRRRFDRGVGYGWRTFARIQRFQRLLLARERLPDASLVALAFEAGYADQAHMARDVRDLSGRTPADLLAAAPRAAGERSETFKTDADPGRIITA